MPRISCPQRRTKRFKNLRRENAKDMLSLTYAWKLEKKIASMLDELPRDLSSIIHSRHLKKIHLRKLETWFKIRERINGFYNELYDEYTNITANISESKELYIVRLVRKDSKNYYWREPLTSPTHEDIVEFFEDRYFPIRGIKGGYIRKILKEAIDKVVIIELPSDKKKAWSLSRIQEEIGRY